MSMQIKLASRAGGIQVCQMEPCLPSSKYLQNGWKVNYRPSEGHYTMHPALMLFFFPYKGILPVILAKCKAKGRPMIIIYFKCTLCLPQGGLHTPHLSSQEFATKMFHFVLEQENSVSCFDFVVAVVYIQVLKLWLLHYRLVIREQAWSLQTN